MYISNSTLFLLLSRIQIRTSWLSQCSCAICFLKTTLFISIISVFRMVSFFSCWANQTLWSKTNQIFLDGYICKKPIYRKTPLGREIADLLLAVNRPYGKSDYIPCICWGRNARFASGFEVGEHVQVLGRIQSREYVKKISETETEKRTAFEVSVSKLECVIDWH